MQLLWRYQIIPPHFLESDTIMERRSKFTLVEDVLNLYDDRFWYYLPGFNGYEMSNDGFIRSMKHYKKYPFGMLIQPKKGCRGVISEDTLYEISNNKNEKIIISSAELYRLSQSNEYTITGYPRRTCVTDMSPRNQRIFIKSQDKKQFDNSLFYPKFNIIKEQETNNCPIESLNGDMDFRRNNTSFNLPL